MDSSTPGSTPQTELVCIEQNEMAGPWNSMPPSTADIVLKIYDEQVGATVPEPGHGEDNYPIFKPGYHEVVAKVLYTGVCQSGTAAGANGKPIMKVKLPHIEGREGVGRIVALGGGWRDDVTIGDLVGIRFGISSIDHLYHKDGSFQEYVVLDCGYLCILPRDTDPPALVVPVLCAREMQAVTNANVKHGHWVVVVGAAGGLGHLAVQYARVSGARVIGIDGGPEKERFVRSLGASEYIDFKAVPNTAEKVHEVTKDGADAVIVTSGSAETLSQAADMLRVGGRLCCVDVPPEGCIETRISTISTMVAKGLHMVGTPVSSVWDCVEAVDHVWLGHVTPRVVIRDFKDLTAVYDEIERGDIMGQVVLRVAKDIPGMPRFSSLKPTVN
ncbi:Uu.00g026570.m01.CDS01 [Anthostomella pinea]|uniref:Uu.00g026570.m01.CDS01 n=1 Tax=Anthostomella pinea TaxID=933095 RepID=A0AAI8V7I8_9PEZI|nr:Uu.00g026570.m01.CDS01 [Anthostomella pinea]